MHESITVVLATEGNPSKFHRSFYIDGQGNYLYQGVKFVSKANITTLYDVYKTEKGDVRNIAIGNLSHEDDALIVKICRENGITAKDVQALALARKL